MAPLSRADERPNARGLTHVTGASAPKSARCTSDCDPTGPPRSLVPKPRDYGSPRCHLGIAAAHRGAHRERNRASQSATMLMMSAGHGR